MKNEQELTIDIIKHYFHYNPETGQITRLISAGGAKRGEFCSALCGGYILLSINGIRIVAHRLIWMYMEGHFPDKLIDHIDGNTINNKWNNLRLSNKKENGRNSKLSKRNKLGVKGVTYCKRDKNYRTHCVIDGKQIFLGRYLTIEEASKVYEKFSKEHFGEFYRNPEDR